jgi:hypothetical protein
MKEKLGQLWQNRFARVWLMILVVALGLLVVRLGTIGQPAPTLSDVLAKDPVQQSSKPADVPLFVASILALSLATLSAAKSFEILKRNRAKVCPPAVEEPRIIIRREDNVERLEALRKETAELSKANSWFKEENSKLKLRIGEIAAELEELSRAEKMLKKSNISLGKESERLRAENELLLLKVNSLEVKPKKTVVRPKSKLKAPTKAKKKK